MIPELTYFLLDVPASNQHGTGDDVMGMTLLTTVRFSPAPATLSEMTIYGTSVV